MDPLPPRSQLVEQVHERLLQAICSRRLAPGSRIAREQLAATLGVSRKPVSHALQLLKQQGLVRHAEGRGLVVAPIEAERPAWIAHRDFTPIATLGRRGCRRPAARPAKDAFRSGSDHAIPYRGAFARGAGAASNEATRVRP